MYQTPLCVCVCVSLCVCVKLTRTFRSLQQNIVIYTNNINNGNKIECKKKKREVCVCVLQLQVDYSNTGQQHWGRGNHKKCHSSKHVQLLFSFPIGQYAYGVVCSCPKAHTQLSAACGQNWLHAIPADAASKAKLSVGCVHWAKLENEVTVWESSSPFPPLSVSVPSFINRQGSKQEMELCVAGVIVCQWDWSLLIQGSDLRRSQNVWSLNSPCTVEIDLQDTGSVRNFPVSMVTNCSRHLVRTKASAWTGG